MMSAVLDAAVFPGTQGGPLEHVIAAKAVAFYEALQPEFKTYANQILDPQWDWPLSSVVFEQYVADKYSALGIDPNSTRSYLH